MQSLSQIATGSFLCGIGAVFDGVTPWGRAPEHRPVFWRADYKATRRMHMEWAA